jgi:hypothetical protein
VCRVNNELWLVDGFHRFEAAKQCGFDTIDTEVFVGTRSDALRASLEANHTHGLRRSNADKRVAAELAVREFSDLSDRGIAEMCGVSHELVGSIKRQLSKSDSCSERKTLGRDGKRRRMPQPKSGKRSGTPVRLSSEAEAPKTTTEPDTGLDLVDHNSAPEDANVGNTSSKALSERPASAAFDMNRTLERIFSTMYEEFRKCPLQHLVELHTRVPVYTIHLLHSFPKIKDVAELMKIVRQEPEEFKDFVCSFMPQELLTDSPHRLTVQSTKAKE